MRAPTRPRTPESIEWWRTESTDDLLAALAHYRKWALRKDTLGNAARIADLIAATLVERGIDTQTGD